MRGSNHDVHTDESGVGQPIVQSAYTTIGLRAHTREANDGHTHAQCTCTCTSRVSNACGRVYPLSGRHHLPPIYHPSTTHRGAEHILKDARFPSSALLMCESYWSATHHLSPAHYLPTTCHLPPAYHLPTTAICLTSTLAYHLPTTAACLPPATCPPLPLACHLPATCLPPAWLPATCHRAACQVCRRGRGVRPCGSGSGPQQRGRCRRGRCFGCDPR